MSVESKFKQIKSQLEQAKESKSELKGQLKIKKNELALLHKQLKKNGIKDPSDLKSHIQALEKQIDKRVTKFKSIVDKLEDLIEDD